MSWVDDVRDWMSEVLQWDRLLSLIVAGVWWISVFIHDSLVADNLRGLDWLALLAVTTIILGLIWFGDELGTITGATGRGYITQESPGCLVKAVGWMFLFGIIGAWIYSLT